MSTLITLLNKFGIAFFYAPFTFAQFRYRLQNLAPEGTNIAIRVSHLGCPISLAMAELFPDNNSAEILPIANRVILYMVFDKTKVAFTNAEKKLKTV
ncbi:MAG: hypothetical protein AB4368_10515 [Xenococcaceae cyanobacterium]